MAQKWYQKATVQQKFVGGGFAVLLLLIPIVFGLFTKKPPPPTPTSQEATVVGDLNVAASQQSTAIIQLGAGSQVTVGISEKAYQAALDKIDVVRSELQAELDREKQRATQLARDVQGALSSATAVARLRPDPEIKRLAEQLQESLAEFDAEFGDAPLSDIDDLRIRLAKATASNAERTFRKTLTIITKEDVDSDSLATDAQIDREVEARQIRGDALYGLREWQEALVNYERILALRPGRWNTRWYAALCLRRLGRPSSALEHQKAIVAHYTPLVEEEGRPELANHLASILNNRGNTLDDQGKLAEALQDYDKAIEIRTRLVEQGGRAELANDLASTLNNRGAALKNQGKLAEALEDYGKAIEIRTRLVEQEGRAELANGLASVYYNRGVLFRAQGKLAEALQDYGKAIEIRTRLVEQEGRSELANDLASVHNNRGVVFETQGKLDKALKEYGRAEKVYARLVEQEGREELTNDWARALNNRGDVFAKLGQQDQAITAYKKALDVATSDSMRSWAERALRQLDAN